MDRSVNKIKIICNRCKEHWWETVCLPIDRIKFFIDDIVRCEATGHNIMKGDLDWECYNKEGLKMGKDVKKMGSSSKSGFHFIQSYQTCNKKFYIKHVLGIDKPTKDIALLFGSAFHEGKAKFYMTGNKDEAIQECINYIAEYKNVFEDPDAFVTTLERCPILLESWIEKRGVKDLEDYEVFKCEQEFELPLSGTDFKATMRIDCILKNKVSGEYVIMETKTSSSSYTNTNDTVYMGDQATMYLLGVKRILGIDCIGVQPDISYWHKSSKDVEKITHYRGELVQRTQRDFVEFEAGLRLLVNEIAQKVQALKNGIRVEDLFPRSTHYCNSYFKKCEYHTICRNFDLSRAENMGFIKNE